MGHLPDVERTMSGGRGISNAIIVECARNGIDNNVAVFKSLQEECNKQNAIPKAEEVIAQPVEFPPFPFLRTYKPMLKRARGTASYEDIRTLLKLWIHSRHIRRMLDNQNQKLFSAAAERDELRSLHPLSE